MLGRTTPDVVLIRGRIEEAELNQMFDLAIGNRTLQHVTKRNIEGAVGNICRCCRMVYLNELTELEKCS